MTTAPTLQERIFQALLSGRINEVSIQRTGELLQIIRELVARTDALQEKNDCEKSCGCSYDQASDVCLHHSPQLVTVAKERDTLKAENTTLNRWLKVQETACEQRNALLLENGRLRKALEKISQTVIIATAYPGMFPSQTSDTPTQAALIAKAALNPTPSEAV